MKIKWVLVKSPWSIVPRLLLITAGEVMGPSTPEQQSRKDQHPEEPSIDSNQPLN